MTRAKQKANEIRFYKSTGEYGFLSNLYPCRVAFEGHVFNSSEHAYQYGKPKDPLVAQWLASAPLPRVCAVAAHALLPYDIVPNWKEIKLERMERVVKAKFSQNPDLAVKLLATGDAELIEESTDAYWGSGPILGNNYHGHNHLGWLLRKIREEMKACQ